MNSSSETELGEGERERDSDGEFAARVFEGNEDVSARISDALLEHINLSRFSVFVSPCRGVVTVQWKISSVAGIFEIFYPILD